MNDKMRRYMMSRETTEDRFRDSSGRDHYDNGRYAPRGMRVINPHGMNRIGFDGSYGGGSYDTYDGGYENYGARGYRMDSGSGSYSEMEGGYASGDMGEKITMEIANTWMSALRNEDGSKGPHWTFEQAKQVLAQKAYNIDPIEFYVAMNMMYSDYLKPAKEFNVNNIDFYACMAKAFLNDKDADDDKLMSYYYAIVEQ